MPTNHTLPQPQTLPPNWLPVTAESAHLPQFHAVQNTAQTAFVLHPKTLARSKYTPPCVTGTPHPHCFPLSPCLTCVCRPTGCLWSLLVYPQSKGFHTLPALFRVRHAANWPAHTVCAMLLVPSPLSGLLKHSEWLNNVACLKKLLD